jgi:hypothetical protein
MAKKGIAAFLLVVIAAWAEMTMAPMFAMHTGHMRSGHDMAVMLGHNHAGHSHGAQEQVASEQPCCPGFHKMESVVAIAELAGGPSCDDPHNCCFRQGPQNVPAPARVAQKSATEIVLAATLEARPATRPRGAIRDIAIELSPPFAVFGMTLRV